MRESQHNIRQKAILVSYNVCLKWIWTDVLFLTLDLQKSPQQHGQYVSEEASPVREVQCCTRSDSSGARKNQDKVGCQMQAGGLPRIV
jgi:hypothetical protein